MPNARRSTTSPRVLRRRRWLVGGLAIVVVALVWVLAVVLTPVSPPAPIAKPVPSETNAPGAVAPVPPAPSRFDKSARSVDDPDSIWLVVNKLRPLNPLRYEPELVNPPVAHANPPGMRPEASDALVAMFEAASAEGAGEMRVQSAYRSYDTQVSTYNHHVGRLGQEKADLASARPGHSEHQTGLTADISAGNTCILEACFASTPQGAWLAQNAHRFGFIMRYPEGLTEITGYAFEPWHYRYVGVELATEMNDQGIKTLEEFFDLPAAPSY